MTGERSSPEDIPESMIGLEAMSIDPVMESILEEVAEALEDLHTSRISDKSSAEAMIGPVNERLDATGWPGALVHVTGRLRLCDPDSLEYEHVRSYLSRLRRCEDSFGEYYDVQGMPLVCSYFRVSVNEEYEVDEESRIGLAFIVPEQYAESDEYGEGDFVIYPSDIAGLEFDQPSSEGVDNQLSYHFPEIHKKIEELIPFQADSYSDIVRGIKALAILKDDKLYHGYQIDRELGTYLFERIGFKTDYYDVVADGPVYSVGEDGQRIESGENGGLKKYRGRICGIIMEDDGSSTAPVYRPSLVMALPDRATPEAFYACVIPAESLISIRELSNKRKHFGGLALMNFGDTESIESFFKHHNHTPDEFDVITRQLDAYSHYSHFDHARQCIVLSIDEDIAKVAEDFADHVTGAEALDPGTPMTDTDYDNVAALLKKSFDRLDTLLPGDIIATKGAAIIINPLDEGSAEIVETEPATSIQGTFVGFAPIKVPEEIREHTTESRPVQLAMIMRHHSLVDDRQSEQPSPFSSPEITILLAPHTKTHFIKLDY